MIETPVEIQKIEITSVLEIFKITAISTDYLNFTIEIPEILKEFIEGKSQLTLLLSDKPMEAKNDDIYMSGVVYKVLETKPNVTVYGSMGGLQFRWTTPKKANFFEPKSKIYLILRSHE